jgi:RNA polymerase sigma-70 factor (ECF subfamily)
MNDPSGHDAVIDAVLRGRTEAFGALVRAYALPLRSYLAAHVHHLDDIDDLAQDVFIAALESLRSFRKGDDFWAWLRGIARNKLLNFYRSTSRRNQALTRLREAVSLAVGDDLDRAAQLDRADTIERLLRCVAELPEKLRQVVRCGLDGARPAELAGQLQTTVGVIYNLHYRANQLLRRCMEKGVP